MNRIGSWLQSHIAILILSFFSMITSLSVGWISYSQSSYINWGWEGNLYYIFYGFIANGKLPYIDFYIEYPPLIAYLIGWPGLLGGGLSNLQFLFFYACWVGFWILCFIISLYFIAKNKLSMNKAILVELLLIVINVSLVYTRYDIFSGILACLGLGLFVYSIQSTFKPRTALTLGLILILIAISFKVYPIIFAPIIILILFKRKQFWVIVPLFISIVILVVANGYFALYGSEKFLGALSQQTASRDIQLESSWAGGILAGEKLGFISSDQSPETQLQNGSFEIYNDYAKDLAKQTTVFTLIVIFVIILAFVIRFWQQIRSKVFDQEFWVEKIVYSSLLLISVFIFLNKTFSAQYIIWLFSLVPLLGLIQIRDSQKVQIRIVIGLIFIISLLTLPIYPLFYGDLIDKSLNLVIILNLRNLMLVPLIWALASLTLQRTKVGLLT